MNWPQKLQGSTQLTAWLNRLLEAAKSCELRSSPSVAIERKPAGTQAHALGAGLGGGTYHAFKLCRNGQQITVHIDSQEDPATVEDDDV